MLKRGRSFIAAFMACAIPLLVAAPVYPSSDTEAGHKYSIACQRLSELRKSPKKKKYRSYWLDCIRTFEQVEKKYPQSPSAGDACFERAGVYQDLYKFNKYSKDLDQSIQTNRSCQTTYPKHDRAPEALYHIIELTLDFKKDSALAVESIAKLTRLYPDSPWTGKAMARFNLRFPAARKKRQQEAKVEEEKIRELPKPPPAAAQRKTEPTGTVKGIRHWSEGAYTRIVIDKTNKVAFQATALKNPDRLVFDLFNARVGKSIKKEPLTIDDGILKQVRASQYTTDTVRVVLDLASIKSYVAFPLHDPERLVIDVTGEGGRGTDSLVAASETGTNGKGASSDNGTPLVKTEPRSELQTTTQPVPKIPEVKDNTGDRLTLSRQMALKVRTIAIDAGHGGHDPGAIGKSGTKEKNITLDIAKRLAALVKEQLGCTVVMTRDKDVFIPLDQRPFIAKSRGADLFVSIHVNANRKRKMRGIETYVQALKASDREAMATAARENATSVRSLSELDSEVEKMLKDLKIDNKIEESIQLAGAVQTKLVDYARPGPKDIVINHGVKSAFFYVLMNTNIPSILAEVGFISNPEEEKMLRKESYRQAIAEALLQGVKNYIHTRDPQMMGI